MTTPTPLDHIHAYLSLGHLITLSKMLCCRMSPIRGLEPLWKNPSPPPHLLLLLPPSGHKPLDLSPLPPRERLWMSVICTLSSKRYETQVLEIQILVRERKEKITQGEVESHYPPLPRPHHHPPLLPNQNPAIIRARFSMCRGERVKLSSSSPSTARTLSLVLSIQRGAVYWCP